MFFFQQKEKDMEDREEWCRRRAIDRYLRGEKPRAICVSLGRTEPWFYKWLKRFREGGAEWYQERSRTPLRCPDRTPEEIADIVEHVRLSLYNHGEFCGAQAIRWELEDEGVSPLPSLRTIGRILARRELTQRRTGRYEPKGTRYPALKAQFPGDVHEGDFVGPCYLNSRLRFHSLNIVDLVTGRCATEPVLEGKEEIVNRLWAVWLRLGLPKYLQVDNETVFYGSQAHPRGMGKLIRLCLPLGIEPCFIPFREPWRNGVVEHFNDFWRKKFLAKVTMSSPEELQEESLAFEERHNNRYRYSKLGGKTPMGYLAGTNCILRFPENMEPPKLPLPKPQTGRYHVVRLIRSDARFNLFGEMFAMPSQSVYEYVKATVDVAGQRLSFHLDGALLDEQEYRLR
jgi:putative transposase